MRYIFICYFLLLVGQLLGQRVTLSGYVREAESGETMIGANIYVKDDPVKGTSTNAYGFYSLSLEPGTYTIVYSYLGYGEQQFPLDLQADLEQNVMLTAGTTLTEVVVTSEEEDENVQDTEMGTVDVTTEQIKKLPAIFGEVDVLKTLQLLPGVQSAGEGSSGLYVRGGGPDQNLVLLDEAVVYNSGHLLGFFSVFNADAIKNTTLIKGGMPANYGGRLSSVIDIQMKEGNAEQLQVDGGIGLVASRLT
ncbi:MAG: TonB-dependent receptor, partial [Bacteroidota bacterium]